VVAGRAAGRGPFARLQSFIHPVLGLAIIGSGPMIRMTRAAPLSVLTVPRVTMAALEGGPHGRLVLRHASVRARETAGPRPLRARRPEPPADRDVGRVPAAAAAGAMFAVRRFAFDAPALAKAASMRARIRSVWPVVPAPGSVAVKPARQTLPLQTTARQKRWPGSRRVMVVRAPRGSGAQPRRGNGGRSIPAAAGSSGARPVRISPAALRAHAGAVQPRLGLPWHEERCGAPSPPAHRPRHRPR
jgi:hypothetical protein